MNIDEQAAADAIMSARHSDDELAERLRQAWAKYVQFFTEPPHGTFKQIRAMLEFMPAAQPKPESWSEIALRSARLCYELEFDREHADTVISEYAAIILAGIERSHAAQPKPESWTEITREAWDRGAIERSHAAQPQHTASHICPDCKVERADYEGEPDKYLGKCPNCGSKTQPQPSKASPLGERSESPWVGKSERRFIEQKKRSEQYDENALVAKLKPLF